MYTIKTKSLGNAWLQSIKLVMQEGENIYDDDRKLKEIRNLYVTLAEVRENDPILDKYADKKRIQLMKKKYSTCGL